MLCTSWHVRDVMQQMMAGCLCSLCLRQGCTMQRASHPSTADITHDAMMPCPQAVHWYGAHH